MTRETIINCIKAISVIEGYLLSIPQSSLKDNKVSNEIKLITDSLIKELGDK